MGSRAIAAGAIAFLALGALVGGLDLAAPAERRVIDIAWRTLRPMPMASAAKDVVVVGIDEATVASVAEPIALWHRTLSEVLDALGSAGALVVGLDLVLPDRSFDAVLPGADRVLVGSMLRVRQSSALVLALTVDEAGRTRPIMPAMLAAAGPQSTGYALWRPDPDRVVRRFDERLGPVGEVVPTFIGQIARAAGLPVREGWIPYALGDGFDVLPMHRLLQWARDGDMSAIASHVRGRIVLVGSVLPLADRVGVPVGLLRGAPEQSDAPGVLVHAQALRALVDDRMPRPWPAALAALCGALAGLGWFAGASARWALLAVPMVAIVAFAIGTAALVRDFALPAATIAIVFALAAGTRLAGEATIAWRERIRLRATFAGYVSPQVMAEIEAGRLDGLASARRDIAVLVLDVRGFTSRSERETPERLIAFVNRLSEEATEAIHAHGGMVDKFMGDGVLALFGAPSPLVDPTGAAFDAGVDLLERVHRMSETAVVAGEAPILVGIGLASGVAVVGNVGAARRHAYTAIGDCVNVAARLEALTKELGYPMILSKSVAAGLTGRTGVVSLGVQTIRGHSPLEVFGWRPG